MFMLFIIALIAAVVAYFVYKNAKKRFQKNKVFLNKSLCDRIPAVV